jgi:hypothetical protein
MGTYTLQEDKKIPQDIVMTLAEISYLARYLPVEAALSGEVRKNNPRPRNGRTRRMR